MKVTILGLLAVVSLSLTPTLLAQDAALAPTPPMGWNSWNKFGCNVSEDLIQANRRRHGEIRHERRRLPVRHNRRLLAGCRDKNGNIVADPQRFPSGIKALGDYIHSLGLKFGDLFRRRNARHAPDARAASATNIRTRANMPPGAWTI